MRRLGLLLSLSLFVAGCDATGNDAAGPSGPPPSIVETTTATPELLRDVVKLVGQLEAEESVVLRAEISGVIDEILFEEGQTVRKGDPLFRLDSERQQAAVREAKARFDLAEDVHRRSHELAERQVLPEAELVRARQELAVAEAALQRERVDLEKTWIRAPFAGSAGARLVSPGARVTPDTDLVSVHATDRLQLVYTLPERAISLARVGMPVEVSVGDRPGETFSGETYFLSPVLAPESRRLLVKAWIPNPEGRLRPGQFADIRVSIAERENAILVPAPAIVHDTQGTFVWRVGSEGRAERAEVSTGLHVDGRIEIREGLAAGDVVVSAGTNKVHPGAVVVTPDRLPGAPS